MPVARTFPIRLLAAAAAAVLAAVLLRPHAPAPPPAGALRIAPGIVRVTGVSRAMLLRAVPGAKAFITTEDREPWPSAEFIGTAHLAERILDDPQADAPGRTVDTTSERYAFGVNTLAEEARTTPIVFLGPGALPAALANSGAHALPPIGARAVASLPETLAKGTAIATVRPYDPRIVLRCGAIDLAPIAIDDGKQGYFLRARLAGCREARATVPLQAYLPEVALLALACILASMGLARSQPPVAARAARLPSPARAPDARAFAIAAVASGVVGVAVLVAIVVAFVVDVPLYDEWLWVPIVAHAAHGTLAVGEMWAAQNVHRSFVPTLLAVELARAFGWHERVQAIASVVFALVAYAIAAAHLVRTRRASVLAAVACAVLVFSLAQIENWLWGFQVAWFLANACAFGAFAFLARRGRMALAGALVLAVCATYTLVFGVLIWPIGAALLLARRRVRALAAWLVVAAVAGALFLVDYHPPTGQIAAAHFVPDVNFAGFLFAYLGAPAALGLPLVAAVAVGALALAAFAAFAVRTTREPPDARASFFLAVGGFAIASALIEAVGRAGYGADAALTSRYTTLAIDLWIALVGLGGFARVGAWRPAYAIVSALAILACAATGLTGAASAIGLTAFAANAREAIRSGAALRDPTAYTIRPTRFADDVRLLRAARLMPFDAP
jgi:hypothetical protein